MGLDILAISKIDFEKPLVEGQEMEDSDQVINLYGNDIMLGQSDGIESGGYMFLGETFSFRAGSYSGYNGWRQSLCSMIGKDFDEVLSDAVRLGIREENIGSVLEEATESGSCIPFAELIVFSDCEGFIGPKTSTKLHSDFEQHLEQAKEMDDRFLSIYADFMEAFALASDGGCVIFC